jgi:hypothetical protein
LNLDFDDFASVQAIIGEKGASKSVRDAKCDKMGQIIPCEGHSGPPFLSAMAVMN